MPPPLPLAVLPDTVAPVNVAAGAVPTGVSVLERPPPVPNAVLLVSPLPALVNVTAPRFRTPPPEPTVLPPFRETLVNVRLPLLLTSAIRNSASPERVMMFGVPTSAMVLVMTGSPTGPLPASPWLAVSEYVQPAARLSVSDPGLALALLISRTSAASLQGTLTTAACAATGMATLMPAAMMVATVSGRSVPVRGLEERIMRSPGRRRRSCAGGRHGT